MTDSLPVLTACAQSEPKAYIIERGLVGSLDERLRATSFGSGEQIRVMSECCVRLGAMEDRVLGHGSVGDSTSARFPAARLGSGMYESFYLRAVSPDEPLAVWIRYTVHKRPGGTAKGSVWCTVVDARRGEPLMQKLTTERLRVRSDNWIAIGEANDIGPRGAQGRCGEARWSLSFVPQAPELRHLAPRLLYRLPLPRTKLTSPAPIASFDGVVELGGRRAIELQGWSGMVGHNWGSEHAERWIWLHGLDFAEAPGAWIDVALGRLRIAGRMTPWVAAGAFSLGGRRFQIGGLLRRGLQVAEGPRGCTLRLPGEDGLVLEARVEVPADSTAGWRYADPNGGEHHVINCPVAAIELRVREHGKRPRTLKTAHGGAYELGLREHDHGVPIAPFADGS
jgi:hypothetical protein